MIHRLRTTAKQNKNRFRRQNIFPALELCSNLFAVAMINTMTKSNLAIRGSLSSTATPSMGEAQLKQKL